jgi:ankyrin repeat protein
MRSVFLILFVAFAIVFSSCGKKEVGTKDETKKDQQVTEKATPEEFFKALDSGKVDKIKDMLAKDKSLLTVKKPEGYIAGFSALYVAAGNADFIPNVKEVADLLIKSGADVNMVTESGATPLHFACSGGNHSDATTSVAELLIDNKANINATNDKGETPIFIAVYWDNENLVKMLKSKGADLSIKNKEGKTPMDVAKEKKIESLINILK